MLERLKISWIFASILLLAYSFTQIDLSLTFSKASLWQNIQKLLQNIGYFQRPLSTYLFIGIIAMFSVLYILTLVRAFRGKLEKKDFWKIFIGVSVILFFSYNAFSYDFFNYIFDAKLITYYNVSPYQFKALDFYNDPMLSFMHSTHRTYPYGPAWIWLTVPFSFFGFNYFILTFYLFKLLIVGSFIGSVYFLDKLLSQINSKKEIIGLVLFALNPLVLIESAVSAHNDIVMVFFALASLYYLLKKRYILTILFILLSIGIKYATVLLVPFFLYIAYLQLRKKEINFHALSQFIFYTMLIAVVIISFASGQNKNPEFQPWYLLILFPFASFLKNHKFISTAVLSISIGALYSYVPYIYNGEWPKDIVSLKSFYLTAAFTLGMICYGFLRLKSLRQ